jgi:hypothetical protein
MSQKRYILFCGTGAALASVAAITALARVEGRDIRRPVNASSHWLWGDDAAWTAKTDLARTGIGGATNLLAGFMWGALFGAYLHLRRPEPVGIVRDGVVLGGLAGLLDYGLLPRRLSPGWELALSSRSVVLSMAAMATGAVLGGLAAHASETTHSTAE